MYKGGAVALVIKKSLNGSFLFSIFCIKLAVIFGSSGVMEYLWYLTPMVNLRQ